MMKKLNFLNIVLIAGTSGIFSSCENPNSNNDENNDNLREGISKMIFESVKDDINFTGSQDDIDSWLKEKEDKNSGILEKRTPDIYRIGKDDILKKFRKSKAYKKLTTPKSCSDIIKEEIQNETDADKFITALEKIKKALNQEDVNEIRTELRDYINFAIKDTNKGPILQVNKKIVILLEDNKHHKNCESYRQYIKIATTLYDIFEEDEYKIDFVRSGFYRTAENITKFKDLKHKGKQYFKQHLSFKADKMNGFYTNWGQDDKYLFKISNNNDAIADIDKLILFNPNIIDGAESSKVFFTYLKDEQINVIFNDILWKNIPYENVTNMSYLVYLKGKYDEITAMAEDGLNYTYPYLKISNATNIDHISVKEPSGTRECNSFFTIRFTFPDKFIEDSKTFFNFLEKSNIKIDKTNKNEFNFSNTGFKKQPSTVNVFNSKIFSKTDIVEDISAFEYLSKLVNYGFLSCKDNLKIECSGADNIISFGDLKFGPNNLYPKKTDINKIVQLLNCINSIVGEKQQFTANPYDATEVIFDGKFIKVVDD